jgi:tetratricopeptide (TPR) repeat protein
VSYWVHTGADTVELSRAYTDMTRTTYATTQIAVVGTYLRLLVLPVGQSLDYDYPIYDSITNPAVLGPLIVHGVLLVAAVILIRGRGRLIHPAGRLVGLGIGWFYLNLLVESSVIPIVDVINEHRIYLPAIGLFLAASVVAAGGLTRALGRRPAVFVVVAVIGLLGFATVCRNVVWQSPVRFWTSVVEGSPGKSRALNNLGVAYYDVGDMESAIQWYRRALEADQNYVKAYYNLGEAEFHAGRPRQAVGPLQVFVRVWSDHPLGHELLGQVYRQLGKTDLAAHHEQIGAKLRYQNRELGLELRYRGEKEPPPEP